MQKWLCNYVRISLTPLWYTLLWHYLMIISVTLWFVGMIKRCLHSNGKLAWCSLPSDLYTPWLPLNILRLILVFLNFSSFTGEVWICYNQTNLAFTISHSVSLLVDLIFLLVHCESNNFIYSRAYLNHKSLWVCRILNLGNKSTFLIAISVQESSCVSSSIQFPFNLNMLIIFINIFD